MQLVTLSLICVLSRLGDRQGTFYGLKDAATQALPFKVNRKPSIFYFGITHHSRHDTARTAHRVWARTCPNFVWFSDTYDPVLNTVVISTPPNTYAHLTTRVLAIWKHVMAHHTGHDWYVRLWDDNWVSHTRMQGLASMLNPSIPQYVGRTGYYHGSLFVGGGPGGLLSAAAVSLWKNHFNEVCNSDWVEDVCISIGLRKLGVQLRQTRGMATQHQHHLEVQLSKEQLDQGMFAYEDRHRVCEVDHTLGQISLHYMTTQYLEELE